jgi:hypothetical protein
MTKTISAIISFFMFTCIFGFDGPLPDFKADWNNIIRDCETNMILTPKLPGGGFDWGSPTPVDWNSDGLYDLLVGYNLINPDSLKLVIHINQGSVGNPKFTGRASDSTCFYVMVRYPGKQAFEQFSSLGYHPTTYHSDGSLDNHTYMGFVPSVFDWNNDGLFDIFITEGTCDKNCGLPEVVTCNYIWDKRGQWLLINTGTLGKPEFGKVVNLSLDPYNTSFPDSKIDQIEFQGLNLFKQIVCDGNFPQATLVDWNSDGIMDINYAVEWSDVVLGDTTAGGQWKPASGWKRQTPEGLRGFGTHPVLRTADFDGDGNNELVATDGDDCEIWLYTKNTNTSSSNYFKKDVLLYKETRWGWHPKFDLWDWDEDGDPDMVCGWGKGTVIGMFVYRTPGGVPGSDPIAGPHLGNSIVNQPDRINISITPNPSPGPIKISWYGNANEHSQVEIFDTSGRLVRSLASSAQNKVFWNGQGRDNNKMNAGIYFIRLKIADRSVNKKLILIK